MILSRCENDPVHYCAPNLLFAEFDILLLWYLKLYLTVIFDFHLFSSVLRMKFRFSSNYVYYFRLSLSCDDLNRDCCYPPTHLSIYVPTHLLTILYLFVAPPHDPITHDTGSWGDQQGDHGEELGREEGPVLWTPEGLVVPLLFSYLPLCMCVCVDVPWIFVVTICKSCPMLSKRRNDDTSITYRLHKNYIITLTHSLIQSL